MQAAALDDLHVALGCYLVLQGFGVLLIEVTALVEDHLFDDAKARHHRLLCLVDHEEELAPQEHQQQDDGCHNNQWLAMTPEEFARLTAVVRTRGAGGLLLLLKEVVHGWPPCVAGASLSVSFRLSIFSSPTSESAITMRPAPPSTSSMVSISIRVRLTSGCA